MLLKVLIFLCLFFSCRPTSANSPGYHFEKLDLDWDGSISLLSSEYMATRIRIGKISAKDVWFTSFGPAFSVSNRRGFAIGAEAELLHLEVGWWGQLGCMYSFSEGLSPKIALGWSLFGVEFIPNSAQNERGWQILAKVRLPLTLIAVWLDPEK